MNLMSSMAALAIAAGLVSLALPLRAQTGVCVSGQRCPTCPPEPCARPTSPVVRGGSRGAIYVPPPPSPGAVEIDRGRTLFKAGQYLEALAAFQQADRLRPNNADILDWLAECSSRLGRYRDAVDFGRRVLQLNPRDGRAAGDLAYNYYQLGDLKNSLEVYQQALQLDLSMTDRTTVQSAIASITQELQRETVKAQEKAAQQAVDTQIRKLEAAQKGLAQSVAGMHVARQAFADSGELRNSLFDLPQTRDGYLKGASLVRNHLKKYPNDDFNWATLAEVLLNATTAERPAAGEINEALTAARRAIALKPDDASYYKKLVVALVAAGKGDEAIGYANVLSQRFKDKGGLDYVASAALDIRKWARFAEAERLLDIVARTSAPDQIAYDRAQLRIATFDAATTKGDSVAAATALRALCKVEATCLDRGYVGVVAMREGRLGEGKAVFAAIVAVSPPEKRLAAVTEFREAMFQYSNNPADIAEVQRAYVGLLPPGTSDQKAIEQAKLGYILLRAGQQQQATAEFQKALTHDSNDPDFYVRMGDILRRGLGEPAASVRFYERALQLDPGNVAAGARLALARQALASGNPGRSPDMVQTGPPLTATKPGALGEADALSNASRTRDGKVDPAAAARAAREAFDGGMIKAGGAAEPVMLGGAAPGARPPAAPSERVQKDSKWQALKATEEKLEARVAEVEQALAESERKLDAAPPDQKAKAQVEVVKQRDQVSKAQSELQVAKVQTESYRLSVDEQPVSSGSGDPADKAAVSPTAPATSPSQPKSGDP